MCVAYLDVKCVGTRFSYDFLVLTMLEVTPWWNSLRTHMDTFCAASLFQVSMKPCNAAKVHPTCKHSDGVYSP